MRVPDGFKGPPIGNHTLRVQWSRGRWFHVIPKGQGHDCNIFEAQYLNNRARQTVDSNWPPIGNHIGVLQVHDCTVRGQLKIIINGRYWSVLVVTSSDMPVGLGAVCVWCVCMCRSMFAGWSTDPTAWFNNLLEIYLALFNGESIIVNWTYTFSVLMVLIKQRLFIDIKPCKMTKTITTEKITQYILR